MVVLAEVEKVGNTPLQEQITEQQTQVEVEVVLTGLRVNFAVWVVLE
jgi:hypothetical protein